MKTLTLDYKKWRCGSYGGKDTAHGRGSTNLLNKEGYMCCLGQFSTQLNPKVKLKDILNISAPSCLDKLIPALSKNKLDVQDTNLSDSAMAINDDSNISIEQKIKKLKSLFQKKGYRIKVTNLPKTLANKIKN